MPPSPDMFNQQRRGNVNAALGNFFFIVPLLVFEIMLTKKLDYQYFGTVAIAHGTSDRPHAWYLVACFVYE